eukprot:3473420-Amphidinium_carterae.1
MVMAKASAANVRAAGRTLQHDECPGLGWDAATDGRWEQILATAQVDHPLLPPKTCETPNPPLDFTTQDLPLNVGSIQNVAPLRSLEHVARHLCIGRMSFQQMAHLALTTPGICGCRTPDTL